MCRAYNESPGQSLTWINRPGAIHDSRDSAGVPRSWSVPR
jgi:hypothetical protein